MWKFPDAVPVTAAEYKVGSFVIDPVRRRLTCGEEPIALTPKVFSLLLAFVEQPGALLTKDQLLQALWPDVAVEENNLTHAIAKLRKALGDDIHERRFIVTVPGQGYRFIAPVDVQPPPVAASGRDALPAPADRSRLSRLLVLPFKVLRGDPQYDFLAVSVPDAITSSLSGFDSITVRSSATASRFAADTPDLTAIATAADVNAILHGTLLHGGDEVRVSAQLVQVPDGTVLWSGTAQAGRGDVFKLQDTLTRRIVDGLSVELTARDRHLLSHDVPANGRAYELYLRANQLSYDVRHVKTARDLYEQSVAADPSYAPAWARLGRICRVIGKYGVENLSASLERAEEAFNRAIALNPDLPLTHGLFAYLEADLGRAHDGMVRLLQQSAIANDPELLAGLVHVFRYCGLLEESVAAHHLARRLDPSARTSVSQTYWAQRQFQKAIEADLDSPSYVSVLAVEGLGRVAEAIVLAKEAVRRPNVPRTASVFLSAFAATFAGERDEALARIDECLQWRFRDPEAVYRMGWVLARLREDGRALTELRRAVEGGYCCPNHLAADPAFDHLRSDGEFDAILQLAEAKRAAARSAFEALRGRELVDVSIRAAAGS